MVTPYSNSIFCRGVVKGDGGFPVKLYDFQSAKKAFSSPMEVEVDLLRTMDIIKHPAFSQPYTFSIALAWGLMENEKPIKAFDVFSYKFDKAWNECNPEVDIFNIKNGATSTGNMCETGTIILGEEGKLRRKTKSLPEYLEQWPDIGDLGPASGV